MKILFPINSVTINDSVPAILFNREKPKDGEKKDGLNGWEGRFDREWYPSLVGRWRPEIG